MSRQPDPAVPAVSQAVRRTPRRLAFLVCFGGAAVLAACGTSAPTRFFTLDPVAPAATPGLSYAGPPLRLSAVNIPPSLDRTELVSEIGAGEMKVHDLEHWEAPLGLTARQVLTQDLAARLPAGKMLGPGAAAPGAVDLNVAVLSFQAAAGQATLQASWTSRTPPIRPGQPPTVVHSDLVQLSAPTVGTDGAATAQGFSALLAMLADRIATDVSR